MDKRLQNLNNSQMMSGVALFSTAALSVYSIKNILDINKKIDVIYEDMEKIKQFIGENQRKNNITASNLGKKLEDIHLKFNNLDNQRMFIERQSPPNERQAKIVEIDEIEDEVNNFLKS